MRPEKCINTLWKSEDCAFKQAWEECALVDFRFFQGILWYLSRCLHVNEHYVWGRLRKSLLVLPCWIVYWWGMPDYMKKLCLLIHIMDGWQENPWTTAHHTITFFWDFWFCSLPSFWLCLCMATPLRITSKISFTSRASQVCLTQGREGLESPLCNLTPHQYIGPR